MKIAIVRSSKAYLPEAEAYEAYLCARGIEARCVDAREELEPDDTAILFRFEDQFARKIQAHRRIHEEHNMSLGGRARLRELAMRFAPRPDGLIRLTQVADNAPPANRPLLIRPCGIDPAIFETVRRRNPDFDLVYCGSLERPGLVNVVEQLARSGITLALYGRVPPEWPRARLESVGVRLFGRISRAEVPEALANARAGLNYTPDYGPLPYQESIKTLEYLAAGLPVVANRYPWAERFAAERSAEFLWLENLSGPDSLDDIAPPSVDVSDRAWPTVFDRVGLIDFLERVSA